MLPCQFHTPHDVPVMMHQEVLNGEKEDTVPPLEAASNKGQPNLDSRTFGCARRRDR